MARGFRCWVWAVLTLNMVAIQTGLTLNVVADTGSLQVAAEQATQAPPLWVHPSLPWEHSGHVTQGIPSSLCIPLGSPLLSEMKWM